MEKRVTGFDLARALAIFGMVIVNFKIAMSAESGNAFLLNFAGLFEGRASALFVILAGIGVTFLTDRARQSAEPTAITKARLSLIKRGLLLVALGLAYLPIWEADILHFYGVYFLIAAAVFRVSNKTLLFVSAVITLMFPVLMLFFDYERNWNWAALTYENLWSLDGMVRHLWFNGFHPVFPWAAFLVFGMWLGRLDLSQKPVRTRLLIASALTLFITEASFYMLRVLVGDGAALGMSADETAFLFSISIIPPLPQYVISAGSSAVLVLITSLYLSERFSASRIIKWLSQTGQLALTLYVAHVIIGMGAIEAMGLLENQSIEFSLFCALAFCVAGATFSAIWLRFFNLGPLEWVFRKIAR